MTTQLAALLAKAKDRASREGSWFHPDVSGEAVVKYVRYNEKDFKASAVLALEILTCHPSVPGALVHQPGDVVKKVYALSKYPDIAPADFKADLLTIFDATAEEKTKPGFFDELVRDVVQMYEGGDWVGPNGLAGVKVKYNTRNKVRKDKPALTMVDFSSVPAAAGNDEKSILARRKALGV